MKWEVNKGVICCDKEIPASPRWFADNRLAIQFEETGVRRVEYRSPLQVKGNGIIFLKGLHDGFRYFLETDGVTNKASYENSTIWPFGFDSEWTLHNCTYKHSLYTVNDSIVIKLTTPDKVPANIKFKLEINDRFMFMPTDQDNCLYNKNGAERIWKPLTFDADKNALMGGYMEYFQELPYENEAWYIRHQGQAKEAGMQIIFGADFTITYEKRFVKHILFSEELQPNREYYFVTGFIPGSGDAWEIYRDKLAGIRTDIGQLFARYQKVRDAAPVLDSPYKELNDFISLSPMYHEALKVTDYPGAIRAKTSNYWVWGWDGITSNSASLYWGDYDFIKEMLLFYETTSHPEKGIAHGYRNDMTIWMITKPPAQGMYITLLHHYYNMTHDLQTVKDRYAFAKKIYLLIADLEVSGTGFCEGTSLYPDFLEFMQETGHDISSFNNTIFYCASRSMECLSSLVGDEGMKAECAGMFKKMEDNFLKLFFDEEKKYFAYSVDAITLKSRQCYCSAAIKWENDYCQDLVETKSREVLAFFEKHLICQQGIRVVPVWDTAFDRDSNQLHSMWPVTGEYFMRLINENNRLDLIKKWIGWVSFWTGKLTIPEGVNCYIDMAEPEMDEWDMLSGTWYAYSVRGWYQAAIHCVVGLSIDAGGLTFFPYEGEEMKLSGLHYLDKCIDIEMCGSGKYIRSIEIAEQSIYGTNQLPTDLLPDAKHFNIKVNRVKENPYAVYIKSSCGVQLSEYQYGSSKLTVALQGEGTSKIKFAADNDITVIIDGKVSPVHYDREQHLAWTEVAMCIGEKRSLEVLF